MTRVRRRSPRRRKYSGTVRRAASAYAASVSASVKRALICRVRRSEAGSLGRAIVEAVFLKMHEVVFAVEFTATVTAHAEVFKAAREARHAIDASAL